MGDTLKKALLIIGALAIAIFVIVKTLLPQREVPSATTPTKPPSVSVSPAQPPVATPIPLRQTGQQAQPQTTVAEKPGESEPTPPPGEEPEEDNNPVLCEHIVSSESQYGFSGEIRLINTGEKAINGWSVTWEYTDGSTITDAEGVALAGNNPYTGEFLPGNARIEPGETVKFSFTGLKGGDRAPLGVLVKGESCMGKRALAPKGVLLSE